VLARSIRKRGGISDYAVKQTFGEPLERYAALSTS
jgi:hypothetical protein